VYPAPHSGMQCLPTLVRILDPAAKDRAQLLLENAALRHQLAVLEQGDSKPGWRVLFHGPSGTGKTMAAEVIAGDLGRELYRVNLSQVVSKYVG